MKFTMSLLNARIAFGRTILYAATDDTRPILNGVLVEAHADGRVVFTATDGFVLGCQRLDGQQVTAAGSVMVPREMIREAMKVWPKRGGTVTVTVVEKRITIDCDVDNKFRLFGGAAGMTITGFPIEGTFPKYRDLFPKPEREDVGRCAFNAAYLSDLAAVARLDPDSSGITRFYFGKPSEPQVFVIPGSSGEFIAVIMPMFVQWDDTDTGLAGVLARLDGPAGKRRLTQKSRRS